MSKKQERDFCSELNPKTDIRTKNKYEFLFGTEPVNKNQNIKKVDFCSEVNPKTEIRTKNKYVQSRINQL